MRVDPVEQELDGGGLEGDEGRRAEGDEQPDVQYVDTVESTPAWNQMRQDLADYMWQISNAWICAYYYWLWELQIYVLYIIDSVKLLNIFSIWSLSTYYIWTQRN